MLKILSIIILGMATLSSMAQENDPFSFHGLGEENQAFLGKSMGMGGLSAAFRSEYDVNLANPASLTGLKYSTMSSGFQINQHKLLFETEESLTNDVFYKHLLFAFPVAKFWSASFGATPYSKASYNISSKEFDPVLDTVEYSNVGSGRVSRIFWANSFKIKNLSFGFSLNYYAGRIVHVNSIIFNDTSTFDQPFNSKGTNNWDINGVGWDLGVQYQKKLNDKLNLVAGIYGSNSYQLSVSNSQLWENFTISSVGFVGPKDTVFGSTQEGKTTIPAYFGGGIMVKSDKWELGAEVVSKQWSDFRMMGNADPALANSMMIKLGASLAPDIESETYWKRLEYRFGTYFGKTKLIKNNSAVGDYGMTFGVGLPLRSMGSRLNLALQMGRRGSLANNLIQDRYFKLLTSVNLNERWFVKRKID